MRPGEFECLELEDEFDDLSLTIKEVGASRCLACYFFDCRCAQGLRHKNLFDDPSQEGYDSE